MKLFKNTQSDAEVALESIKALLYNDLHGTKFEYQHRALSQDIIMETKVKDMEPEQWLSLLHGWLFDYHHRNDSELKQFSDEAIVNEMNCRIQAGSIDSSPRFFVTNKGSIN